MQQNKNITGECKQNLKLCKRRGLPMQELWDVIAKVLPTTYRLDGKPTKKGVYINKGNKVVIK